MTTKMKCEKIRPLFAPFEAGGLDAGLADRVKDHLCGCPSCRGFLERTHKLRALLALKRHEQPDEFYYRTYLPEFHRRLYSNMVRPKSLWGWVRAALELNNRVIFALRAGTVLAGAILVMLSLYTAHLSLQIDASQQAMNVQERQAQAIGRGGGLLPDAHHVGRIGAKCALQRAPSHLERRAIYDANVKVRKALAQHGRHRGRLPGA